MKLYHAAPSPFVRKVMVTLHETGQLDDVEIVDVQTVATAPAAELMPTNPLAKIPALERDEGPAIYDSRVICAYLDDRANAGLYGEGNHRWETLTLEATGDGIMDAGILMVYEGRIRPEDKQFDGWVDAQWSKIERTVAALNQRWMSHLHGPMGMGHIAVGCALGYLDFRMDARNWRAGNDALAAWYKGFAERPSMQATIPPAA
ncbi:MAG: glutathione S-transferase [Paracoccaceae bacterium]